MVRAGQNWRHAGFRAASVETVASFTSAGRFVFGGYIAAMALTTVFNFWYGNLGT